MSTTDTNKKEEAFEKVLEKLEDVVRSLENDDLPLEEALVKFEEGVRLSRNGSKRLEEAERRIEEILSDGVVKEISISEEK